jgi:hypothetical protein
MSWLGALILGASAVLCTIIWAAVVVRNDQGENR